MNAGTLGDATVDEKVGGQLKLLDVILNDVEKDILSDALGNKLVEVEVEFLFAELVFEEFKTLGDAVADGLPSCRLSK